ncbi:hypothetical protein A3Q56_08755, partial [Intoshia linei]
RAIKALQAWILGIRQTGLEECCTFIADTFIHCWLNATACKNIASYHQSLYSAVTGFPSCILPQRHAYTSIPFLNVVMT